MTYPPSEDSPGTLYDGDGMRLAGYSPEFTPTLNDSLPFKVVLRHHREASEGGQLGIGDRLWLLPDALGTPPELPEAVLDELVEGRASAVTQTTLRVNKVGTSGVS